MSAIPFLSNFVNSTNQSEVNVTGGSADTSNSTCGRVFTPNELFVALSFLSLLENILVVVAIFKNRNLHSPMYYFICCLAVSDMLVSVSHLVETSVILMIEHGVVAIQNNILRQMDNIFDMMICSSVVSSLSFLGAIAVDRYITIFYALRYHSIMTIRRAVIAIILIWVASSISSIIFIVYHSNNAVIICLISFFLFMLILMVTLYIHMFALARHHAKSISTMQKWRTAQQRTSMKGAITLTILLGIFFLCWGPFFMHLTLIVTCPKNPICLCVFNYFNLFLILIICNSVIDPIIYAFRSQELRKTLKEIALCSW
ncbi:melanocyte-stimulating hormone receptor [Ambystoma mexicanum]|uniref:melanocyte-stimulating hormone receptor n=1 Tax=Ambystoma mexicanum TaxID=8296 RepID=UPI0037E78446